MLSFPRERDSLSKRLDTASVQPCLQPCLHPYLHPCFALPGQAFTRLFAGGVAGMVAAAVVYPLEVIKTILTVYPEEASGIGEAVEASSPALVTSLPPSPPLPPPPLA